MTVATKRVVPTKELIPEAPWDKYIEFDLDVRDGWLERAMARKVVEVSENEDLEPLTKDQVAHLMADSDFVELLQQEEYEKCEKDFVHFYLNYWKIPHNAMSETPGWNLPDPNRVYQIMEAEILQSIHDEYDKPPSERSPDAPSRHQIRLKARQIGFTTLLCAMASWCGLFHTGHSVYRSKHNWLVLSQGEEYAKSTIRDRIRAPLRELPEWLKDMAATQVGNASQRVVFETNADGKIRTCEITALATTPKTARSFSVFGAIFDEAAFNPYYGEAHAGVKSAVTGPEFVLSTANGRGNWFANLWEDSEKSDSAWDNNFWGWYAVPDRGPIIEKEGDYTSAWYAREKHAMRNDLHLFFQENPATPQEAFAKSGQVAFDDNLLDTLDIREPLIQYSWDFAVGEYGGWVESTDPDLDPSGLLMKVWELPWDREKAREEGWEYPNYVLGADVAEGLEHGDLSTFCIFNANTGNQAASFKGKPDLDDFDYLIEEAAKMYNMALIGIENNTYGHSPITELLKRGYPRMFRAKIEGNVRSKRSQKYGWNTNKKTKALMIASLRAGIKDHRVDIHDEDFIIEAKTFVANGRGSYEAVRGKTDDSLISAMIAYQMVLDVDRFPYEAPDEDDVDPDSFLGRFGFSSMEEMRKYVSSSNFPGYIPDEEERMFLNTRSRRMQRRKWGG